MNWMRQLEVTKYIDIFSSIVKPLSIWLVLMTTIYSDWVHLQIDISNAFLHGELDKRALASQSIVFKNKEHVDYVCHL